MTTEEKTGEVTWDMILAKMDEIIAKFSNPAEPPTSSSPSPTLVSTSNAEDQEGGACISASSNKPATTSSLALPTSFSLPDVVAVPPVAPAEFPPVAPTRCSTPSPKRPAHAPVPAATSSTSPMASPTSTLPEDVILGGPIGTTKGPMTTANNCSMFGRNLDADVVQLGTASSTMPMAPLSFSSAFTPLHDADLEVSFATDKLAMVTPIGCLELGGGRDWCVPAALSTPATVSVNLAIVSSDPSNDTVLLCLGVGHCDAREVFKILPVFLFLPPATCDTSWSLHSEAVLRPMACRHLVKVEIKHPWPPPLHLEMQFNGIQFRPIPWPSFTSCAMVACNSISQPIVELILGDISGKCLQHLLELYGTAVRVVGIKWKYIILSQFNVDPYVHLQKMDSSCQALALSWSSGLLWHLKDISDMLFHNSSFMPWRDVYWLPPSLTSLMKSELSLAAVTSNPFLLC